MTAFECDSTVSPCQVIRNGREALEVVMNENSVLGQIYRRDESAHRTKRNVSRPGTRNERITTVIRTRQNHRMYGSTR